MTVYTNNPSDNILTIQGILIDGIAAGAAITHAPEGDSTSTQMGVDTGFVKNVMNQRYILTIPIIKGSPSLNILNTLAATKATVSYAYYEAASGTVAAGKCFIQTEPTLNNGAETEALEYVFSCVDVEVQVFGEDALASGIAGIKDILLGS